MYIFKVKIANIVQRKFFGENIHKTVTLVASLPRKKLFAGLSTYQNGENIYQITINYTNQPQNIPSGHNTYQHLPLQGPPKLIQIWIFGLKIYHLAAQVS
jgi:hypothetical protein